MSFSCRRCGLSFICIWNATAHKISPNEDFDFIAICGMSLMWQSNDEVDMECDYEIEIKCQGFSCFIITMCCVFHLLGLLIETHHPLFGEIRWLRAACTSGKFCTSTAIYRSEHLFDVFLLPAHSVHFQTKNIQCGNDELEWLPEVEDVTFCRSHHRTNSLLYQF